ncbi:MAG: hypothetical protein ACRERS_00725 [Methylococcales bacterium]
MIEKSVSTRLALATIAILRQPPRSLSDFGNQEAQGKSRMPIFDIELKQTRFDQQVFGEGRDEGGFEGEAMLLLHQLEGGFGPLPETAREKVADADGDTLYVAWSSRSEIIGQSLFNAV